MGRATGGKKSDPPIPIALLDKKNEILLNTLEHLANVDPDTKMHTHNLKTKKITAILKVEVKPRIMSTLRRQARFTIKIVDATNSRSCKNLTIGRKPIKPVGKCL